VLGRLKSWLFPRKSLEGIAVGARPVRVRVEGTVISENASTSPMTERRGVVLEYRFYDRWYSGQQQRPYSSRVLARGRRGDSLVVDVGGKLVMVPVAKAKLVFAGTWTALPVPGLIPDEMIQTHPNLDVGFEDLCYDEKLLQMGSRVRLTGSVEAEERARAGAYRGGGGAPWDFEAKPEIGSFIVEELFEFPDDMGI